MPHTEEWYSSEVHASLHLFTRGRHTASHPTRAFTQRTSFIPPSRARFFKSRHLSFHKKYCSRGGDINKQLEPAIFAGFAGTVLKVQTLLLGGACTVLIRAFVLLGDAKLSVAVSISGQQSSQPIGRVRPARVRHAGTAFSTWGRPRRRAFRASWGF